MTTIQKLTLGAFLAVLAFAGVEAWRVRRAEAAQIATAFALVNEQAAHDTTRALAGRQLAALKQLYGDSIAGVTRLLEQRPVAQDAFSRANGSTTIGTTTTTVGGASASGTATASHSVTLAASPETGARTVAFDVRAEPFTSHAVVTIGATRDSLSLQTTLDKATLTTRLECGAAEHGVRPASIVVAGPAWLATVVQGGTLEPRLCNDELGKSERRWSLGVTAGYGATASGGTVHAGPSITAGISFRVF